MAAQSLTSLATSHIEAITIRLHPGEDLKLSLEEFINKEQIKAACILTCVGSLQRAALRFANKHETDILTEKLEIVSLTGTLAQTGSHLHLAVSDCSGKTVGGHLKEGSLIFTTAEVVLAIMPGVTYHRETDETYGYKELVIRKNLHYK